MDGARRRTSLLHPVVGINARDDLLRRSAAEPAPVDPQPPVAPRDHDALGKVLVAAAWASVPLTMERACHISKLDERETREVLNGLVADGQLDEVTKAGVVQWVRSRGASR